MAYRVIVDPNLKDGYELRGGNREFLACRSHQAIVSGPSDTGKTVTACVKLHLTCCAYPNSQHAMIRKVYGAVAGSCAQTFDRVIQGAGVKVLGQDSPRLYTYPNGAQVWVGGMDNPEKALSSERDTIYVNQAEQLTLKDWEMLSSRCTGRAAVVKFPQINGDCNPGGSKHWIQELAKAGKLSLFRATHKDNPTIYDRHGEIIPEAEKRIVALSNLTGVRRKRLFEGIWATAEGAVYDMFDAAVHVIERPDSEMVAWYLAMDEGYTNPQVTLLIGEDSDKRWHVAREFYVTGKLESDIVAHSKGWWIEKRCKQAACDEAAAGLIAALNNSGINCKGGKGRILDGIWKIQDKLKIQKDGRPRLTVDPSCVETINEFESYVWRPEKDVPVDENNHSMGALRYLNDVLSGVGEVHAARPTQYRDRVSVGARRGESMW